MIIRNQDLAPLIEKKGAAGAISGDKSTSLNRKRAGDWGGGTAGRMKSFLSLESVYTVNSSLE